MKTNLKKIENALRTVGINSEVLLPGMGTENVGCWIKYEATEDEKALLQETLGENFKVSPHRIFPKELEITFSVELCEVNFLKEMDKKLAEAGLKEKTTYFSEYDLEFSYYIREGLSDDSVEKLKSVLGDKYKFNRPPYGGGGGIYIKTPTGEYLEVGPFDSWSAGGRGICAFGSMYLIVEHLGNGNCAVVSWRAYTTAATGQKCGMFGDEEMQFDETFETVKGREFQLPEGVDFKSEGVEKTILEILKK